MNRTPDVELVLRAYFADDGLTAPDHVLDAVEQQIRRQPRRRSWRLQGRPLMNRYTKLVAGLAAALIVVVGGWQLLASRGGSGGQPTATPAVSPTPTPTQLGTVGPTAFADLPNGTIPGGTYVVQPYHADGDRTVLELTVPPGWTGFQGWAIWAPEGLEAPDGLGIAILRPVGLFSDPCHWDAIGDGSWPQNADVAVGQSAADLAAALKAQAAYQSTPRADTTLDGHPVKRVDLALPTSPDPFTACDKAPGTTLGTYMPFGPSDRTGSNLYAQGPGQIWHLWILDIGSRTWVVVINDYDGTSAATYAAAEAIVASIRIRE